MSYDIIVIRYHSFANVLIIYNNVLINVFNANIIIVHANFQSTEGICSMMYQARIQLLAKEVVVI